MLFNSFEFLIFFPIVCLIYFAIPKKVKWIWLLLASYYFYMCWNPRYALLMFASTLITWLSGIFIDKFNSITNPQKAQLYKNITVGVSFASNLAILFFFKYFDFAVDSVNAILSLFNITIRPPKFDVILPVGISFYTFQALSYTMDIYRREISCERNLFRYMLFVSFFPQLVAGPIERSKNLICQLREEHSFDAARVKSGLMLMLWGFFQKLVIADRAAIVVNTVYADYASYGGLEIAIATILFALQIYCDFASYTDIAKGAARVMGFNLMDNFRQPYFSKNIAEFWRRWHISLSGWFRDYLYIPLGGNRKGTFRKYLNIMIVFLASGLWHGANLTFLIWGALHGMYQIAGSLTLNIRNKLWKKIGIKKDSKIRLFTQISFTFCLVCFGWIFFRADSLSDAFGIIHSAFSSFRLRAFMGETVLGMGLDIKNLVVLGIAFLVLLLADFMKSKNIGMNIYILSRPLIIRWSLVFILLFTVLIFGIYGPGYNESQFIYFQF